MRIFQTCSCPFKIKLILTSSFLPYSVVFYSQLPLLKFATLIHTILSTPKVSTKSIINLYQSQLHTLVHSAWIKIVWTPQRLHSPFNMSQNTTILTLPPLPSYTLRPQTPLLSSMSDTMLSLVLPIVAYWLISGFFHIIDTYNLLPQYRLHTPAELLKRNHATQWNVFRDVVLQQVIQTIFGISASYFDPEPVTGMEEYDIAVWATRLRLAQRAIPWVFGLTGLNSAKFGQKFGGSGSMLAGFLSGGNYPQLQQLVELNGETVFAPAFASWELQAAKVIYWAVVPAVQLMAAILIMDTWQYFLHRGMHMNHWLYSKSIYPRS